ncbi:hypothetical protein [Aeromonas sp. QDB14]|uniref:hypothetical protein n=1 Tax=Aeromonas sp. QDB14 TaxID=2989836 RepID=UPI0022E0E548|nr:hypothetical protein [Aeromonas sp. QDB14]
MEYWREFQALVAIGFNNQFSVIELESADERALGMVQDDISEAGWANCAGIDTDVPGLYMVKASINLNSDDEPEYANTVQLHIPADHEHQFRFNVNTISGPM